MAHIHDKYDFTVSFFLLHPSEPKICLHYHLKLNFWNQLGGHIELDESPIQTLHKELEEEAGLKPKDYTILDSCNGPKGIGVSELPNPFGMHMYKYGDLDHYHIDMPYVIKCKTNKLNPQKNESQRIDWFSIEQIRELMKQQNLDTSTLKICEWIAAKYF